MKVPIFRPGGSKRIKADLRCPGLSRQFPSKGAGLIIIKGASFERSGAKALPICSRKDTDPLWKVRQGLYTAFDFRTT